VRIQARSAAWAAVRSSRSVPAAEGGHQVVDAAAAVDGGDEVVAAGEQGPAPGGEQVQLAARVGFGADLLEPRRCRTLTAPTHEHTACVGPSPNSMIVVRTDSFALPPVPLEPGCPRRAAAPAPASGGVARAGTPRSACSLRPTEPRPGSVAPNRAPTPARSVAGRRHASARPGTSAGRAQSTAHSARPRPLESRPWARTGHRPDRKRRRPHLPWRAVRALSQQQNAGLPSCAVRPALTPPTVVPSRVSRGAIGQLITRISLRQRSKTPSNER
jgi:hypothetical protein